MENITQIAGSQPDGKCKTKQNKKKQQQQTFPRESRQNL